MDTKKVKFGIYILTVLISLYSAFQFGKDNVPAAMLIAATILGIGGYFIIIKRENDTFLHTKDDFAFMWTVLYLVLPIGGHLTVDNSESTFQMLGHALAPNDSLPFYYLCALVLLLAFWKKWSDSQIYRIGLYVIVSLIAEQIFQLVFGIEATFIFAMAAFAILCEHISIKRVKYKPVFHRFLLICIVLFVVLMLCPHDGSSIGVQLDMRIRNLFYLGDVWPRVDIILLISGAICMLDNYKDLRYLFQGKMAESFVSGGALICVAIYIFLGKVWPQFFNINITYIAAPSIILLINYVDKQKISDKIKLFTWIGILFCLPAAAKTLNERSWFYYVIVALCIIRFILLKIIWKNNLEKVVKQAFWGVAATMLLFSSRYEIFDVNVIRSLSLSLVVLIGSWVLWIILTYNTYAFDKQLKEGLYKKNDYDMIPRLQMAGINLIMLLTLFVLLL